MYHIACLQGLGLEALKKKAEDMWNQIVKLETEKYDLEERQKRQDYDVRMAGCHSGTMGTIF